ncbi:MAG: hypothetical protein A3E21_03860 [Sulfurimonas sp. RIFCSPHIGHO2_12_FULL_36_9]|uniref:SIMPL domain-containing protein n=1 Tax=Sulfurimonas sp. RIFCSPLOWO2_12_36_12 TaxID=1802253 RepID=UPI0008B53872|nr:SIMPL domain-containing protein [Sulfurimonas sp. RIFCSPLOWO2_12_36_12]OHD96566.1 MAG: hypothetical protein A3E21_03860 [Sulfurimonas sp. RIFCSPHIGHO2_12_FULL_36_9]OHE02262.1 MAG: hypothetical protein A2W82_00505 [Sulfurimonas sp. RIFCSPLOWO2_12_36_12]OHE05543.1 MAG: hypothetical protein A3K14_00750 [Sulfurimonas sp. RIFCSPLOWO2_12_FULL_36_74]
MKKYFSLLFIPMLIGAQMSITTTEQVSQMLTPDVLQASLGFDEQSKNINSIKTDFNAIIDEVKKFDPAAEYCNGGGYNLSPVYNYKNQKPEFVGYSGHLQFNCEFNMVEQFNTLNENIKKIISNRVRTTQGALLWSVGSKTEASVEQELQLVLLKKAKVQADNFSKETLLECEVSTVKFNDAAQAKPIPKKMKATVKEISTQNPIQSNKESVISATVAYKCSKK